MENIKVRWTSPQPIYKMKDAVFIKEAVTQHLLSHKILSDYFDTNRRDLGRLMEKCGWKTLAEMRLI
jgi:hypothetical protein